MPRRKKKFIDKKNATTYQLIHRSQKDPLQADEDAPKMVLVTGDELAMAQKKERLAIMGVYYDDGYDYEQHIKTTEDLNKVQPDRDVELFRIDASDSTVRRTTLPADVLPSEVEEEVGMLELAAPVSGPRLDWDPDIVATLDSDNDEPMDDDLEDDFIAMANQSGEEDGEDSCVGNDIQDRQRQWIKEQMMDGGFGDAQVGSHAGEEDETVSSDFGSEDLDEVGSMQSFSDDDAKTRFTNYSMSSSIIRRNEGLTLIDDKFEQMYAEYDDDEIGALDHEDIDGKVSTSGDMMEYLLQQHKKQMCKEPLPEHFNNKARIEIASDAESSEEEMVKVVVDGPANRWDCESIQSTFSNLHNHPKIIEDPYKRERSKKIKLTKKLGIPLESVQPKGLTRKQLQALDRSTEGPVKVAPLRTKDETPEDKRERKSQVKEERKERRVEKKNTKVAFKQEGALQRKQQISSTKNQLGQKIL